MPIKILIAEDIAAHARLMAYVLEESGYEVTIASDGWEAVDEAVRENFALILMDVHMPKIGGLEATKIIRANEATGLRVPVFALTANVDDAVRCQCTDVGMDGFVAKPVGPSALLDTVKKALAMTSERAA